MSDSEKPSEKQSGEESGGPRVESVSEHDLFREQGMAYADGSGAGQWGGWSGGYSQGNWGDDADPEGAEGHRPPLYTLKRSDDGWDLVVELPGTDPADIDVRVSPDDLVITADTAPPDDMPWFPGQYYGALALPERVDPEGVEAEHRHGVLIVHLPRKRAQRRSVSVSVDGT